MLHRCREFFLCNDPRSALRGSCSSRFPEPQAVTSIPWRHQYAGHRNCSWCRSFSSEIRMSTLDRIALVLVIIGAINWGLVGLFQFDLVAALFGGQASTLA